MTSRPSVEVHVIARLESKRVPRKNLRLLAGKPLVSYAIEAARGCSSIDRVFVNTESEAIAAIARDLGADVFQREAWLAADDVVLDQTTYAFAKARSADVIGMVNPVCPLTTPDDIQRGLEHFLSHDLDSLITVREERLHAFVSDRPVNFDTQAKLPMTQALPPVQIASWNFCFWKRQSFIARYEAHGHAVFGGNLGFFPIDKLRGVKISDESDWQLAEALLATR